MAVVIPPNSPEVNPAPVRTPLDIRNNAVYVKDEKGWLKFFEVLYAALLFLLQRPVFLSGLDAAKPDATLYPENSRYYSTDTTTDYINLYSVPGDHTTAVWTAIP
jgi:hypothetical protein